MNLCSFVVQRSLSPNIEEVCQSADREDNTNKRQFLVEIPRSIEISPVTLFRHLADRLDHLSDDNSDDAFPSYLIRPKRLKSSLSDIAGLNDATQLEFSLGHILDDRSKTSDVRFSSTYKSFHFSLLYT